MIGWLRDTRSIYLTPTKHRAYEPSQCVIGWLRYLVNHRLQHYSAPPSICNSAPPSICNSTPLYLPPIGKSSSLFASDWQPVGTSSPRGTRDPLNLQSHNHPLCSVLASKTKQDHQKFLLPPLFLRHFHNFLGSWGL